LKVDDDATLGKLVQQARQAGLIAETIRDAGRTQIAPNSRTVAAIGPGPVSVIDFVTGHLKLY
jgi:peptidyl-tRNA hydrolase, PTH2 family